MATKAPRKLTAAMREVLTRAKSEPELNVMDYKMSMIHALQYYNVNAENKKKVEWCNLLAKKNNIDLSSVPDSYLNGTKGALSRLILVDQPVENSDKEKLIQEFKALSEQFANKQKKKATVEAVSTKPVEDKNVEDSRLILAELEGMIDEIILADGNIDVQYEAAFKKVANKKATQIAVKFLERRLAQFVEARDSDDPYIKEGWNINRRKLNRVIKMLESAIESAATATAVVKKVLKTRVKKEKPAAVIVKNIKYLKESAEYNIKSLKPEAILEASEVVLFNTKSRRISILRALQGSKLNVRGTSIIDNDPAKSITFGLRKPEIQLKEFVNQTKRNIEVAVKSIKTVIKEDASGRLNQDTLIIAINR